MELICTRTELAFDGKRYVKGDVFTVDKKMGEHLLKVGYAVKYTPPKDTELETAEDVVDEK